MVKNDDFKILKGEQFKNLPLHTNVAKHYFCSFVEFTPTTILGLIHQ